MSHGSSLSRARPNRQSAQLKPNGQRDHQQFRLDGSTRNITFHPVRSAGTRSVEVRQMLRPPAPQCAVGGKAGNHDLRHSRSMYRAGRSVMHCRLSGRLYSRDRADALDRSRGVHRLWRLPSGVSSRCDLCRQGSASGPRGFCCDQCSVGCLASRSALVSDAPLIVRLRGCS